MSKYQQLRQWITANKQIGKRLTYEKKDEICWSSVAIQKWENVIKVYVDEILESQMNAENYIREEIVEFQNIDDAIDYVEVNTMASPEQLKPCKGQKIFNPKFKN